MNIWFLFILLAVVFSCAKGEKPIGLKITLSGVVSPKSANNYAGGLMLYGANPARGIKFAKELDSSLTYTLSSSVGEKWNFFVYGWTGPSKMEGEIFCSAALGHVLVDGPNVIELTLSDDCKNDVHFTPSAYNSTSYNPLQLFLCDKATNSADIATCTYNTSMATGVKVVLTQHETRRFRSNLGSDSIALESECKLFSAGSSSLSNLKVPTAKDDMNFPVGVAYNIFYGSASCTGADCCTGRREVFHLDSGYRYGPNENFLFEGYSMHMSLRLIEKPDYKLKINETSITSPVYKSCYPIDVSILDKQGLISVAPSDQNFSLSCEGTCSIYSDATCSTTAYSDYPLSILATTSQSVTKYIRPKGAILKLKVTGSSLAGGDRTIPRLTKTYSADLDEAYARSILNNTAAFTDYFPSEISSNGTTTLIPLSSYYAFRSNVSNNGGCTTNCDDFYNYGYLKVLSHNPSTTTMTFDFKTYDSDLLYRSGSGINYNYSTYNCLDFELPSPPAASVPYQNDVCFQVFGNSHLFNIQGNYNGTGASFIKIPSFLFL